ncbi:MAG TPA: dienelactone hydrolase family protein [Methylomirabilota bacterium]|nr:dienelactone hydrolase family protein [Methylomirabilota bacterium]
MTRTVLVTALALALLPAAAAAQPVAVEERTVEYTSGDVEVPAFLAVPRAPGPHPAVLFVHGRSGWHDRLRAEAVRLAARGFVVLAPDYHTGRMIPENPIAHDPATERDVELGLDRLKAVPAARGDRVGVVGISRGGYHMLRLAVRRPEVAALVGYYPHLANPNDPEPVQVYRYAPEVEQVRVPALLMVGDRDQQLRLEQVIRVGDRLRELGVPVEVVVYPGAQRAFDFRRNGRTLGDDLAREDALNRTAAFLARVLGGR